MAKVNSLLVVAAAGVVVCLLGSGRAEAGRRAEPRGRGRHVLAHSERPG